MKAIVLTTVLLALAVELGDASSIAAARVIPGSAAHEVGGVASRPLTTANRLLAEASEQ